MEKRAEEGIGNVERGEEQRECRERKKRRGI